MMQATKEGITNKIAQSLCSSVVKWKKKRNNINYSRRESESKAKHTLRETDVGEGIDGGMIDDEMRIMYGREIDCEVLAGD